MAVDLKKLQGFYASRKALRETDGTSTLVVDWLAGQPATGETTVDAIVAGIGDRAADAADEAKLRSNVIKALKMLAEETNCGEFKTGRHGNVSRMKWSVDPTLLRAAAAGEVSELEEWEPPSSSEQLVEVEIRTGKGIGPRLGPGIVLPGGGHAGGVHASGARRAGGGPARGRAGGGPLATAFPNLDICVDFFASTKSWSEPVLAAARAGLWDDDVPPPEWEQRLDRLEEALDAVRLDERTTTGAPPRGTGPGPRPSAFHKRP